MIIEHRNSRSYDIVMTKLQWICDNFMIIIFLKWPLMLFLLAYLYVQLCNIFVYGLCICLMCILGNWLLVRVTVIVTGTGWCTGCSTGTGCSLYWMTDQCLHSLLASRPFAVGISPITGSGEELGACSAQVLVGGCLESTVSSYWLWQPTECTTVVVSRHLTVLSYCLNECQWKEITLVIKKEVTFAWHGATVSRMHICITHNWTWFTSCNWQHQN